LLGHLDGASGQELARRTGVTLATLTGIIDRLVAQNLVARREDPRDRRVRRLELTPAGAALVDRVVTAGEEYQQRLLQRLDPGALAVVANAFDLILAAAVSPDEAACQGPDEPVVPGGAPTAAGRLDSINPERERP
jgi:DNA-binding MarR family transcriptional regulator